MEIKSHIEIDLLEIRKQMVGINPKLSLYQKLQEKEKELEKKLGYHFGNTQKRCKTDGCKRLGKLGGGYKCPDTGRNIKKVRDYCSECSAKNKELNENNTLT